MIFYALLIFSICAGALSKRIVGGHEPLSATELTDPAILSVAQKIAIEFDKTTSSVYTSGVVRVVEGTKQVVSGMNYELSVEIAESNCKKPQTAPCSPLQGAPILTLTAQVWTQPWRNFYQVTLQTL